MVKIRNFHDELWANSLKGMGLVIVDAAEDDLALTAEGLIVSNVESRTSKRSAFCIEVVVQSMPRSNLALFSPLRKLSNRPSSSLFTSTVKLKCGFRFVDFVVR